MKNSSSVAPHLLGQITAYQQNYFNVANLIEDSQTKIAALETVAQMETKMQEV